MPRTTTVLLPDVNVLLAGFRTDHIHHRPARACAYLAALALEERAQLVTFDRGFGRYPRLSGTLVAVDDLTQKLWSFCVGSGGHVESAARTIRWFREEDDLPDWWVAGQPRRRS